MSKSVLSQIKKFTQILIYPFFDVFYTSKSFLFLNKSLCIINQGINKNSEKSIEFFKTRFFPFVIRMIISYLCFLYSNIIESFN